MTYVVPEATETTVTVEPRRTCWQVEGSPRSVYVDADGLPVAPEGGAEPWTCASPCTKADGSPVDSVAMQRRKMYLPKRPDYPDDPIAMSKRDGRFQEDELHLAYKAPLFLAQVAGLPLRQIRATMVEVLDRAMAEVTVVISEPRDGQFGDYYVVDVGGFRDFFDNGPEGAILITKTCGAKRSKKRCSSKCRGDHERPPLAAFESIQALGMTAGRWTKRHIDRISDHLIGIAGSTGRPEDDAARAATVLRRLPLGEKPRRQQPGSQQRSDRARPRSPARRADVTRLRILRRSGVGSTRSLWVEGGRRVVLDLPDGALHDPEAFLQRHPYVEFVRGIAEGFASEPLER